MYPLPSADDIKACVIKSYNDLGNQSPEWSYEEARGQRYRYTQFLFSLLPNKKPISVLELGCGAGRPGTELLLSHPNVHVMANDISPVQLRLHRQTVPQSRVRTVEGDMMDLNIQYSSFDAVVAFYSILHIPKEEQQLLFQRIAYWLVPGGLFLANFGAEEEDGRTDQEWLADKDGVMFWSSWGDEGTCRRIEYAGMDIKTKEVVSEGEDDAAFLWVVAQKRE